MGNPTLVLEDGNFRFVEPLECATEELVTELRATEHVRGPNLATFVIGVIATAVGGILTVRGTVNRDGAGNPSTYGGAAGLAIGLPFAIGPWVGNRTVLHPLPPAPVVRRRGPAEPCGARPVAATSATLIVRGLEVYGRVDANGTFAVSPYVLADAYAATTKPWDIDARIDTPAGARTASVVIDGHVLAAGAATFLGRSDFDAKVEPMRLVPGLAAGTLRVSLTETPDGPAARVVLAVANAGPGPAYGLRGQIAAPTTPSIDGRILYFGHIAKGATVTRELLVPLSPTAAAGLRNATIELALELRDAHGTAPTAPVRFRGAILVDAPR